MTQRALVAEGSSSLCRFLVSCLRRALRCPVDAVHTGQELAVAIENSPYTVLVVGDALASPLRPALERAVRAGRTVVLVGGDDPPATIRGASALARPRSGSAFDGAAFALAVSSLIAENDGAAQSASYSFIR